MNGTVIGIDLGTCNIKISEKSNQTLICEKNMIAIENGVRLYAYGDNAYEMYEKAPDSISVTFPMNSGVIADYNHMQMIVQRFLEKYFSTKLRGATVIIAVPTDITEVEKRAYYDLLDHSKYRLANIYACEKPLAAAVGLDLPIMTATGTMIVDMGADTTEVSVLSLGGIVISRLIKTGGNDMIRSIINSVKIEHSLVIGYKTAAGLLQDLGFAKDPEPMVKKVVGRNMLTGFPVSQEISSELVYQSIRSYLDQMTEAVKYVLERTPPELSSDIMEDGIYLSGGVSQLKKLPQLLSDEVELEINVSKHPIENIAIGLGTIAGERRLASLATCKKGKGNR